MKKLYILFIGGLLIFTYLITVLFSYSFITNVYAISDLIFSKDSNPYGIPYSEWIGKW